MEKVYISENAYPEVLRYLESTGRETVTVPFDPRLGEFTGDHADLRMIRLCGRLIAADEADYRPDYPENASFCALAAGGFFVHRLDITNAALLNAARSLGMALVNVRQGYARCSALPIDGRSVITADAGIVKALRAAGLDVLEVRPGGVALPGFREGFIGGAAGRVGASVVFNGDLSAHPDFRRIKDFCEGRGVAVRYFAGLPLRDIGSIIG